MNNSWWKKYNHIILEIFVVGNLSFLAIDILLAHSYNDFAHSSEWIPFVYSVLAALVLIPFTIASMRSGKIQAIKTGYVFGSAAIVIGIIGMILHLESTFFASKSLKGLVYTAPFVAPLSYTALGLLLLLNRIRINSEQEWSYWVIFFAWGGFVGNFALALCDHAQNGFFYPSEWIPVVSCALAVSFLLMVILGPPNTRFIHLCFLLLGIEVIVGALGFYWHLEGILTAHAATWFNQLRYGPPLFAPLLIVDISILGAIGLYDLKITSQEQSATTS